MKSKTLQFVSQEDFVLSNGQVLNPLELAYETYGELDSQKSNAIWIHHALSTHSHVASNPLNSELGWWENMVGPDKPIDTNRFFVICVNNLGGCHGSSGPLSQNPKTNSPYQNNFPDITIEDMVKSQYLLLAHLEIPQLYSIIGNSMGAMLSLCWASLFPDSLKNIISISSSYKSYPATMANRAIQRDMIRLDPEFNNGFYEKNPINGFKLARKFGHLTYRNPKELNNRFSPDELESYLEYNATKFISHFDANSYIRLTQAMDWFDLTKDYQNPIEAFSRIKANCLIVSVNSDKLFHPFQQQELYDSLKLAGVNTQWIEHQSSYGHDAFLVEIDQFGKYIKDFLIPQLGSN